MAPKEIKDIGSIKKLTIGDLIVWEQGGPQYVVTNVCDTHVTATQSINITDTSGWTCLEPEVDEVALSQLEAGNIICDRKGGPPYMVMGNTHNRVTAVRIVNIREDETDNWEDEDETTSSSTDAGSAFESDTALPENEDEQLDIYIPKLEWSYRETEEGETAVWRGQNCTATVIDSDGCGSSWIVEIDGSVAFEGRDETPIHHFDSAIRQVEDWLGQVRNEQQTTTSAVS